MVVFRFLVFVVSVCAALKLPAQLDLANVNEDLFVVEPLHIGLWFNRFKVTPVGRYEVRKVTYGDDTLWEETGKRLNSAELFKGDGVVRLAKLNVVDTEGNLEFVFFNKVDDSLVLVGEEEFNAALEKLKENKEEGNWLKLDLKDEGDGTLFKVKKQVLDGMNVVSFTPKENWLFGSVNDGEEVIWEREGNDGCSLVALRKLGEEPHFLTMEAAGAPLYFEKVDGTWTKVSKEDFDAASKKLKESIPTLEKLVFEVTEPADEDKFEVTHKTKRGLKTATANPKPGYEVHEVTFDGATVWKGLDDETAGSVGVGWEGNTVKLVSLKLFSNHAFNKVLYYKNEGGDFLPVSKAEFNTLAADIVNGGSVSGESTTLSDVLSLDTLEEPRNVHLDVVKSLDSPNFSVAVGNEKGLNLSDFTPKKGCHVTEVYDNGRPLWSVKGKDGPTCRRLTVYQVEDVPAFAKLFLVGRDDPLFYINEGGSWLSYSEGEFTRRLTLSSLGARGGAPKPRLHLETPKPKVLKSSLSGAAPLKEGLEDNIKEEPALPPVSLNLLNPEEADVKAAKYISVGFDTVKFTARPGSAVGEVLHGSQRLWHGEGKEKCTEVTLYSKDGASEYLVLVVEGEKRYFLKKDGSLSRVDKNDFDAAFRNSVESEAVLSANVELGKKVEL